MTNSIADLGEADVVLVIGSNTTEAHPIVGIALKQAARSGTRLFVIDPREVPLVRHASAWLPVRPGANVALLNAMMRVVLDEGLADEGFIAQHTEGFESLRELLGRVDLEQAAETCGVSLADIREAAIAYGSAQRASIVYAMGVTQHTSGTDQVRATADLAMLTGNVGRPGTGVNPLRGQNNVQGACDVGCLPDFLPGYRPVADRDALDDARGVWGYDAAAPDTPGLTVVEMMHAAAAGTLKAMYVVGENPALSDPDQSHVAEALGNLEFLVVQDLFLTETAEFADVVLPAASFLEKDGTFTNTERRVQLVRKVVDAPGEALPDGEILMRLAVAMGRPMPFETAGEVMDEIARFVPQYGGVSHARLQAEGAGLQWPCPQPDHPGTPVLHSLGFARGRGAFAAVEQATIAPRDATRPLTLTTGRDLWHFHTDTMTGRCGELSTLAPDAYLAMNPLDAAERGLRDGSPVDVTSDRGCVRTTVRLKGGTALRRGVVYMPFHFAGCPANRLVGDELDPTCKIPGLKETPVSVSAAVAGAPG